jgi:hypothetical protein
LSALEAPAAANSNSDRKFLEFEVQETIDLTRPEEKAEMINLLRPWYECLVLSANQLIAAAKVHHLLDIFPEIFGENLND